MVGNYILIVNVWSHEGNFSIFDLLFFQCLALRSVDNVYYVVWQDTLKLTDTPLEDVMKTVAG